MSTFTVNTHDAKSRLSELIRLVEKGDEVFVARNGVTVAQIVLASSPMPKRTPGLWKGKMKPISPEDWAAADQEILAMFEESGLEHSGSEETFASSVKDTSVAASVSARKSRTRNP